MIDVTYKYRNDCKPKQDPDKYSKRLKQDHCLLWSKELANKKHSRLSLFIENNVIIGKTNLKCFDFAPDSITNAYSYWDKMKTLREEQNIKTLLEEYDAIDYTIGSSIIFPIHDDSGSSSWTINKARGCSRKICDRIDLTLECIRLYYLNKNNDSPLKSCLNRYNDFFELFGDFEHYVKFFFLDDLVSLDYKKVISFTGTIDFDNPLPTKDNYALYIKNDIEFIKKRNKRIKDSL